MVSGHASAVVTGQRSEAYIVGLPLEVPWSGTRASECNRQGGTVGWFANNAKKAANRDRRPRPRHDASSQHDPLMLEARGTPAPVPTRFVLALPRRRYQMAGVFGIAEFAAPLSPCAAY